MEIEKLFSTEELWTIVDLLESERYTWTLRAYDVEHPYADKRRKDKSEEAKRFINLCCERANYVCDLSNRFVKYLEHLE